MRKILISLLAIFFALQVNAQKEWHMLTDAEQKIAIVNVDYLLAADNDNEFCVVCKDGSKVEGVTSISFEYCSSVKTIDKNMTLQLFPNPVVETLNLTGCKEGLSINILSLDGRILKTVVAQQSGTAIDVSDLASGYYLLQTPNTTIKFIKK